MKRTTTKDDFLLCNRLRYLTGCIVIALRFFYFGRLFIFMSPEYATSDLSINVLNLKKSAHMVRGINHTLRQRMLFLIHENKRMTVSAIYGKLGIEQSVTSQHLSILRNAGFVQTKREGKFIFYSVNSPRIKQINQSAEAILSKH